MGAGGSGCAKREEGARCPECPGAAWDGVTALGAPALALTPPNNERGASGTGKGTAHQLTLSEKSFISLRLVGASFLEVIEEKGRRV